MWCVFVLLCISEACQPELKAFLQRINTERCCLNNKNHELFATEKISFWQKRQKVVIGKKKKWLFSDMLMQVLCWFLLASPCMGRDWFKVCTPGSFYIYIYIYIHFIFMFILYLYYGCVFYAQLFSYIYIYIYIYMYVYIAMRLACSR